jgi:hypothetical protein
MAKKRIVATVDDKLLGEMRNIHEAEVKSAEEKDRTMPRWSNTVEMLLRKGAKAYKSSSTP